MFTPPPIGDQCFCRIFIFPLCADTFAFPCPLPLFPTHAFRRLPLTLPAHAHTPRLCGVATTCTHDLPFYTHYLYLPHRARQFLLIDDGHHHHHSCASRNGAWWTILPHYRIHTHTFCSHAPFYPLPCLRLCGSCIYRLPHPHFTGLLLLYHHHPLLHSIEFSPTPPPSHTPHLFHYLHAGG